MIKFERKYAKISLTPLVDVVFILLIFFMATLSLSKVKSVTFSVPKTYIENPIPVNEKLYIVTVDEDRIFFKDIEFNTLDDMEFFVMDKDDKDMEWGLVPSDTTSTLQYLRVWRRLYALGIVPKVIPEIQQKQTR